MQSIRNDDIKMNKSVINKSSNVILKAFRCCFMMLFYGLISYICNLTIKKINSAISFL